MRLVRTTSGQVDASELGRILIHEHFTVSSEGVRVQFPHLFDAAAEHAAAVAAIRAVQRHGVQTICDPTCLNLGRDAPEVLALARDTGMQIVACTGLYPIAFSELPTHFKLRHADAMADCFVHDIEVGIQGTELRAHFIKVAADAPGITPDVEKLHRAAARASVRTGAPIMAHSSPGHRTDLKQMQIFTDEGVNPAK